MFNISTKQSSGFQDWLVATNGLHLTKHLERGRPLQDYVAIQAQDIKAQPQDQFLVFCDDEAGICGSAAIVALPYGLEIQGHWAPQGTWMLRNVCFHISRDHPVRVPRNKLTRIAQQFHQALFEYVWHLAQVSNHRVALSLQQELDAHKDLTSVGGFTFAAEMIEEHQGGHIAMAVMPLTERTYKTFARQRRNNAHKINAIPSWPISHVTQSLGEVRP